MLRKLLLAAVATGAMGLASQAAAADFLVNSVTVFDWDTVAVPGHGNEVSTGIVFNNDLLVFCVDLEHNIYVQNYNPALVFTEGLLTVDGAGNVISEATSNRIGQLADLGRSILNSAAPGYVDTLDAIQASIWSIEYNTLAVSGNSAINSQIAQFITVQDNGRGYARSLIAHGPGIVDGVQNMVIGGAVPEPATWALMIGGFGLAGAALRRRRATAVA